MHYYAVRMSCMHVSCTHVTCMHELTQDLFGVSYIYQLQLSVMERKRPRLDGCDRKDCDPKRPRGKKKKCDPKPPRGEKNNLKKCRKNNLKKCRKSSKDSKVHNAPVNADQKPRKGCDPLHPWGNQEECVKTSKVYFWREHCDFPLKWAKNYYTWAKEAEIKKLIPEKHDSDEEKDESDEGKDESDEGENESDEGENESDEGENESDEGHDESDEGHDESDEYEDESDVDPQRMYDPEEIKKLYIHDFEVMTEKNGNDVKNADKVLDHTICAIKLIRDAGDGKSRTTHEFKKGDAVEIWMLRDRGHGVRRAKCIIKGFHRTSHHLRPYELLFGEVDRPYNLTDPWPPKVVTAENKSKLSYVHHSGYCVELYPLITVAEAGSNWPKATLATDDVTLWKWPLEKEEAHANEVVIDFGYDVGVKLKSQTKDVNNFYPIQWLIRPLKVFKSPGDWKRYRDVLVRLEAAGADALRDHDESSVILRCGFKSSTNADLSKSNKTWEDRVRFEKVDRFGCL
jgi:hypothetical protein